MSLFDTAPATKQRIYKNDLKLIFRLILMEHSS